MTAPGRLLTERGKLLTTSGRLERCGRCCAVPCEWCASGAGPRTFAATWTDITYAPGCFAQVAPNRWLRWTATPPAALGPVICRQAGACFWYGEIDIAGAVEVYDEEEHCELHGEWGDKRNGLAVVTFGVGIAVGAGRSRMAAGTMWTAPHEDLAYGPTCPHEPPCPEWPHCLYPPYNAATCLPPLYPCPPFPLAGLWYFNEDVEGPLFDCFETPWGGADALGGPAFWGGSVHVIVP